MKHFKTLSGIAAMQNAMESNALELKIKPSSITDEFYLEVMKELYEIHNEAKIKLRLLAKKVIEQREK